MLSEQENQQRLYDIAMAASLMVHLAQDYDDGSNPVIHNLLHLGEWTATAVIECIIRNGWHEGMEGLEFSPDVDGSQDVLHESLMAIGEQSVRLMKNQDSDKLLAGFESDEDQS